jgi:hypothetical protein
VYTKLTEADPDNAPDLVIGGKPSELLRVGPDAKEWGVALTPAWLRSGYGRRAAPAERSHPGEAEI